MTGPDLKWHPYVTRARHLVFGEPTLPGLRVYEIGTPCLAARLPDYRVVLTFDDVSLVLGDDWYIGGVEDPNLLPSRAVRGLYVIEDAFFLKDLDAAILALEQEKQPCK